MIDITKKEEKVDKKELFKDSVVAFIPMLIIISTISSLIKGFDNLLPIFIVLFGTPIVVGAIRKKNNIQFTKKAIIKIVLIELCISILVFMLIVGVLYFFF